MNKIKTDAAHRKTASATARIPSVETRARWRSLRDLFAAVK